MLENIILKEKKCCEILVTSTEFFVSKMITLNFVQFCNKQRTTKNEKMYFIKFFILNKVIVAWCCLINSTNIYFDLKQDK